MRYKSKSKLGQNFLVDRNIQKKIIEACKFQAGDYVLEIGAGRGELTKWIAPQVKYVFALEIDSRLCLFLRECLKDNKNCKILNRDILKFNLRSFFSHFPVKIKIVGNVPYYITTPILERIINLREKIDSVFVTVQKEFAQRIIASPGSKDYGSLSCFIQYYTQPKIAFYIKRSSFFPAPNVDSCFLCLKIKDHKAERRSNDEKKMFQIIRAAFNQRRKTLRNSLKGVVEESKLSLFFSKFDIDPNSRPEQLGLRDFINLSEI